MDVIISNMIKRDIAHPLIVGLILGFLILIIITFALFRSIDYFGQRGLIYWFVFLFIIWRISKAMGKRSMNK